jgi:hypothetical protein
MRPHTPSITAILFLVLLAPTLAVAQNQPASTYTKDEIDTKLKDFESKTETDNRFRGLYTKDEIDNQLKELRDLIAQNSSKTYVDTKIAEAQKAFKDGLDSADKINLERKADLGKLIDATDKRIPSIPPWVAILVSGLISIGAVIASVMMGNKSVRTSTAIAAASKEEGQRAIKEARAYSVIAQWQTLSANISRTRDLFANPGKLVDASGNPNKINHAILVDVGNFYELMAEQWRNGTTDIRVLERNGLKDQAKEFWDGLQVARTTLPALDTQIADWTELQALATS